jgi:hypothetical protein
MVMSDGVAWNGRTYDSLSHPGDAVLIAPVSKQIPANRADLAERSHYAAAISRAIPQATPSSRFPSMWPLRSASTDGLGLVRAFAGT